MPRFATDDKVSYIGSKLAGDVAGSLGIVCARVQNNPEGYVVSFGNTAIVVHESRLVPFQGHLKGHDDETSKKKDLKVEKRRGRGRREEPSDDE